MKVAVIADTHDVLLPEMLRILGECDAVFHAGDVCSPRSLDTIRQSMRPGAWLYMARGNNDGAWASGILPIQTFELEGVKILLLHDRRDVGRNLSDRQVIIYGHSHSYEEETRDGRLWLNPGSCGQRRFSPDFTMALLYLEKGTWRAERVCIQFHPEVAE